MLAFRNPIQFVVTTTTRQDNHPQQTQVPVGLSTHEVLRWIAPTSAKQSADLLQSNLDPSGRKPLLEDGVCKQVDLHIVLRVGCVQCCIFDAHVQFCSLCSTFSPTACT